MISRNVGETRRKKYSFCERLLFKIRKTVCIKNYRRWAVKTISKPHPAYHLWSLSIVGNPAGKW